MIRNYIESSGKILRNNSTAHDNAKGKYQGSASSTGKFKMETLGFKTGFNLNSNRVQTSTSNDKNKLNTCPSNKSLKTHRQNTVGKDLTVHLGSYKLSGKVQDKQNKQQRQQKKGTAMIKTIKTKIVGLQSTANKQEEQVFTRKFTDIANFEQSPYSTSNYFNMPSSSEKQRQKSQGYMVSNFQQMGKKSSRRPVAQLRLDSFQLGRKLGKGRFGDVYMARQRSTGFALAIKVIHKKQIKNSAMEAQLLQQIKIQIYSNHPNILKMYGFFNDDKNIYLLLELATHGCLFKQIRTRSYLPEDQSCYYFRQVCSGIRYLHSNFVLHRDIKPENILNCFNVMKICDFGWAIYSPIYQRQTFCGTLDYVPPEIVTGQFYDEKADVWCLGVLCYQLCTGKAPFQSQTDQNQTYNKILNVQIEFPIYMTKRVVDLIQKILNRDPEKRINLQQIQSHIWMKAHQNQSGRMICKQIWDAWMKIAK